MQCPQCDKGEIDAGKCTACGCRFPAQDMTVEMKGDFSYTSTLEKCADSENDDDPDTGSVSEKTQNPPAAVEVVHNEETKEPRAGEAIPSWKIELSKRLHEIKQKRQNGSPGGGDEKEPTRSAPVSPIPPVPISRVIPTARNVEISSMQHSALKPLPPLPRQKPLEPLVQLRLDTKESADAGEPRRIQNLIDNVMLRQTEGKGSPEKFDLSVQSLRGLPEAVPETVMDKEGKLILLSRTLSGLVDLICVVLCTVIFILSADFFSGILFLDSVSLVYFSALFLLVYFVYSLFFLSTSYQTLGMMITDLRVVGTGERPPSFISLLGRCGGYLVSLFGLGLGLGWSLLNRENQCLHDRLSGTRVVRA
jgi:uncharacterized RDD family membrane protein YckC